MSNVIKLRKNVLEICDKCGTHQVISVFEINLANVDFVSQNAASLKNMSAPNVRTPFFNKNSKCFKRLKNANSIK
ncbi:MAG: hypothetical protein IKN03_09285 [Fibrobacter sp.]|nr:hypothetical protein [Fibrobacter sp.]